MNLRPTTLRWRLTLWYSGSLSLVFLLLGSFIYALVRYQLLRHHDHVLEDVASQVEAVLSQQPDCEHLTPEQSLQLDRIGWLILFHEAGGAGRVFYRSTAALDTPLPPSYLDSMTAVSRQGGFEILADSPPMRIYTRPYKSLAGRRGIIRVAAPLGDVTAPLSSLSLALLLLAPLAVAASGAAGYWLARNALAPVDAITRLAREIEATSLEHRLPPSGAADEIGRLVETFNQMIARLEGSFEGMKRFTADASHELRAPLARMRGAVDIALSRPRQGDEYRKVLAAVGDDVNQLRSITEDLLVLARADAGRIDLEKSPVRLDVVAIEAVESLIPTAEACGVAMCVESDGPVVVLGDERWLRQLVANLLDNALRFAPLGVSEKQPAEVVIRVSGPGRTATLSVEDTGPGLPPEALERAFERFYRGNTTRAHPSEEGVGLGLAIAAWIAQAHEGTITAENLAAGGSRFVVRLPCPSTPRPSPEKQGHLPAPALGSLPPRKPV